LKKINELEKKNKLLQNDLKIEKFPDGAMVYIIEDYSHQNFKWEFLKFILKIK